MTECYREGREKLGGKVLGLSGIFGRPACLEDRIKPSFKIEIEKYNLDLKKWLLKWYN